MRNMMEIDPVEFGRVLGRLDAQDLRLAELKASLQILTMAVEKITQSQERAAGGFRVAYIMFTVLGGMLGAAISPLLNLLIR